MNDAMQTKLPNMKIAVMATLRALEASSCQQTVPFRTGGRESRRRSYDLKVLLTVASAASIK